MARALPPSVAVRVAFGVVGALALGAGLWALDTRFPGGRDAVETPETAARGRALLDAALEAHGGRARLAGGAALSVVVDDRWGLLVERLSVWPGHSARIDLLLSLAPLRARMAFEDGEEWGMDGEPWVRDVGGDPATSPKRFRAAFGAALVARLLLAPFAVDAEGRHVVLLEEGKDGRPHVLSARLPRPNRPGYTVEWRLALDPRTSRIVELVFPNTATEAEPIERCVVKGYREADGLVLPSELECTLANAIEAPLHDLRVLQAGLKVPREDAFHARAP